MPTSVKAPTATRKQLPWLRRLLGWLLRAYMRAFHDLRIDGRQNLPPRGPALILVNHASLLDVPAMMAVDPYPDTGTVAKASLFEIPVVGMVLREWGAVPVERQGRDTAGVRALLTMLREGRVVAVAAEGRRTRSGHLDPINPVLARIAVGANVPLIPVGIVGSFEALPPGARFPRRRPIVVRVGPPFSLPRSTSADVAAQRIRTEIAALLPPHQQPIDDADEALEGKLAERASDVA